MAPVSKPKSPETSGSDAELAVAISYQPNQESAPRLVAKGEGWVARQIIEVAQANDITIRKDADLAQILSKVDINSEIPLEAFTVVAEILSYIYEKNKVWPDGIKPTSGQTKGQKP
ncbi:MAG: EscU/YscU/HrcU family type III secretion system export apparatus switch protein [Magnetovibrio sp.]|nr:EscU/YscU/HrcU family type III secretion system export apparatus switch protein [Magnetovibrio sp.]